MICDHGRDLAYPCPVCGNGALSPSEAAAIRAAYLTRKQALTSTYGYDGTCPECASEYCGGHRAECRTDGEAPCCVCEALAEQEGLLNAFGTTNPEAIARMVRAAGPWNPSPEIRASWLAFKRGDKGAREP